MTRVDGVPGGVLHDFPRPPQIYNEHKRHVFEVPGMADGRNARVRGSSAGDGFQHPGAAAQVVHHEMSYRLVGASRTGSRPAERIG